MRLLNLPDLAGLAELSDVSELEARRFVRCARCSDPRRHLHGVALLLLALFLFNGAAEAINLVTEILDRRFAGWPQRLEALPSVLWLIATAVLVLVPTLLVLCLRDWLIRCRLRCLLEHRVRCPGCKYSLDGVPPRESGVLVCPECGLAYPPQRGARL